MSSANSGEEPSPLPSPSRQETLGEGAPKKKQKLEASAVLREVMLSPGCSNIDKVIQDNSVVIDKTLFIRDFMKEGTKVCCILRPRRFGKSLNLSMLKSFYSLGAKAQDFERFAIGQDKAFVEKHCGKYPVIYLSLKDCKGDTWDDMYRKMWDSIVETISYHKEDLPDFLTLLRGWNISLESGVPPPNIRSTEKLLQALAQALFKKYKQRAIILIDEYDTPLNHAVTKGFYEKVSKFLGSFYSAALKDNSALQQACLVGMVEIRGAGILGGLNNVGVYSVASEVFSEYFGFTEKEIRDFLGSDDEEKFQEYMKWYNGYRFGSQSIINPSSFIMSYRMGKLEAALPKSAATGTLAHMIGKNTRDHLLKLIPRLKQGESFHCSELETNIDYESNGWDIDSMKLHFSTHWVLDVFRAQRLSWLFWVFGQDSKSRGRPSVVRGIEEIASG